MKVDKVYWLLSFRAKLLTCKNVKVYKKKIGLIENEGSQSISTIEFQCKVTYLKKCEGI